MTSSLRIALAVLVFAGSACKTAPTTKKSGVDLVIDPVTGEVRVPADPAAVAAAAMAATEATSAALDLTTKRCVGWRTLPPELPWKEILDPDRAPRGSMSAGSVASGVLLNAVELKPDGEHYSIIERHRRYKTRWGTEELVELIQFGAKHVAQSEGGAPLRVGNMSRQKGGDIRWSNSHNSGRDADLAFYVLEKKTGRSIAAPDLLRFVDQGAAVGRDDLVFDTARNWRLVEGLLSHPSIDVQWLFISIPLKELLLEHARKIGAAPETIRRAESVLHQPTDSSPHNDHFHLRITCPKDDRLDGCQDYGPQWEWADWHKVDLLARALRLSETFAIEEGGPRVRALEYLDRTKNPYGPDVALVWGVWDADRTVVEKSMAVVESQWGWSANALVQVQKFLTSGSPSPRLRDRAYSVLRRSRDPLARDFALSRLISTDVPADEKALAAHSLSHFMEPELVAGLIGQLATQPPVVRVQVALVLRRITNRTEGVDWAKADEATVARAIQNWRGWQAAHEGEPRDVWLADGFRAVKVPIAGREPSTIDVDALLAALQSDQPHIVYNANRTIRELTGRWAPLEQDDGKKLVEYWEKWWKKNRERILADGPMGDG